MSAPLLQSRNHHSLSCGDPPIIKGDDPNVYLGYFQNAFGEQWVFSYDRTTRKAELRGGDIGWNTVHEVRDGKVGELVLGREELAWLQACWKAATGPSGVIRDIVSTSRWRRNPSGDITMRRICVFSLLVALSTFSISARGNEPGSDEIFLLPYFLGNGETGVYFAFSRDGLKFDWLNDGKVVLPSQPWGDESLTRDPSIVYHDGTFHMIWTTSWNSRSIGYASSKDLLQWSKPKKIDIWGDFTGVRNTWAPELHWDPEKKEFLILWSSTTFEKLNDGDGSGDPHGYDHRTYASRTTDFKKFSKPALFFSPQNPEYSVIDPFIAHDDRGTENVDDDRWVMVIKNELAPERGGKNLRLTFSRHMQGPYDTTLGPPIVGAGTKIVDQMGEGPSLFKRDGLWFLYWDAPGSRFSYCLATSPDLETWTNRSAEMSLPAKQMRHGTVLVVPANAVADSIK